MDIVELDPEFYKENLIGVRYHITPRIPNHRSLIDAAEERKFLGRARTPKHP